MVVKAKKKSLKEGKKSKKKIFHILKSSNKTQKIKKIKKAKEGFDCRYYKDWARFFVNKKSPEGLYFPWQFLQMPFILKM